MSIRYHYVTGIRHGQLLTVYQRHITEHAASWSRRNPAGLDWHVLPLISTAVSSRDPSVGETIAITLSPGGVEYAVRPR